jgi:hypothetical protein
MEARLGDIGRHDGAKRRVTVHLYLKFKGGIFMAVKKIILIFAVLVVASGFGCTTEQQPNESEDNTQAYGSESRASEDGDLMYGIDNQIGDEQTDNYNDGWTMLYEFVLDESQEGSQNFPLEGSIAAPSYLVTESVFVTGDCVSYLGYARGSVYGISSASYKISDDILYIQVRISYYPYAKTGTADLQINDERINNISKVILWDENDEKNNETVWGKNNGYSVRQQARVEDISSIDVRVGDGCIEYEGLVTSDTLGYVGCRYKIVNGNLFRILYIQPYVNLLPDFAEDGKIDIRIEDACIDNNIGRVILGFEDNENKITIWNSEDGFLGAEGIKESFDNSLGFSVGGYRKRQ